MTRSISVAQRRDRLARRHLLVSETRTDDVAAIADALVALHSSDPASVHLSALVRMRTPSIATVERALYEQRSVLRHHAMRRTLWVATPPLMRAMHAAATRKIAATEHKRAVAVLADNGIQNPETWLAAAKLDTLRALQAGPLTARALGSAVPSLTAPLQLAPGKAYAAKVSAHTRVLLVLGFDGALIRTRPAGTWISGAYAWSAMDTWVPGGIDTEDEREACRVLADAWLRRFGPGTTMDLQWWSGWTLSTTRRALADAAALPVDLEGTAAWVAADDEADVESVGPWVALLPGLDPTVMGWKDRAWYLPAAAADSFDRNGNAGPTIWVDGHVLGAWAQAPDGEIRLHWFLDVPARRRKQVAARAEELATWIGATRFSVRFPGAIQKTLLPPA